MGGAFIFTRKRKDSRVRVYEKSIFIFVVAIVLGGGYYLMQSQQTPDLSRPTAEETATSGGVMTERVKEVTIDGFEFGYDQKTITVKKGDTVNITLTNSGKMLHDWVLDEFNAKTKEIKNGETDSISFVAGTAGTFEYYCSVGSHRAMGMVGTLVVEE